MAGILLGQCSAGQNRGKKSVGLVLGEIQSLIFVYLKCKACRHVLKSRPQAARSFYVTKIEVAN